MGKEREINILNVKRDEVTKKLRELGARYVGRYNFRRIEFLLNGRSRSAHSWVRVRTDGKKTTITLKEQHGKGEFTPMDEYEVDVNNFREAVRIMDKLASSKLLYFENSREAYLLNGSSVTIDKWPFIPAFVEIESPSTKKLKETYKMLKISGKFIGNVPIHKIYGEYGLDFREMMGRNDAKLMKLLGR